uniref:Conserved secreted protein n=1 Tax=Rhabditophanes sp. KR3021 TaxID=114890 RepID=A0AC35UDB9_9BILA
MKFYSALILALGCGLATAAPQWGGLGFQQGPGFDQFGAGGGFGGGGNAISNSDATANGFGNAISNSQATSNGQGRGWWRKFNEEDEIEAKNFQGWWNPWGQGQTMNGGNSISNANANAVLGNAIANAISSVQQSQNGGGRGWWRKFNELDDISARNYQGFGQQRGNGFFGGFDQQGFGGGFGGGGNAISNSAATSNGMGNAISNSGATSQGRGQWW